MAFIASSCWTCSLVDKPRSSGAEIPKTTPAGLPSEVGSALGDATPLRTIFAAGLLPVLLVLLVLLGRVAVVGSAAAPSSDSAAEAFGVFVVSGEALGDAPDAHPARIEPAMNMPSGESRLRGERLNIWSPVLARLIDSKYTDMGATRRTGAPSSLLPRLPSRRDGTGHRLPPGVPIGGWRPRTRPAIRQSRTLPP
jgi:hypothetical protein